MLNEKFCLNPAEQDEFIFHNGTKNKFSSYFAEHASFATFLGARKVEEFIYPFLAFIPNLDSLLRKEHIISAAALINTLQTTALLVLTYSTLILIIYT